MKRLLISSLFVVGLLTAVGCSQNPTPATPLAAQALTADAIVVRVNEVQASVIQACGPAVTCQPGSLSTTLARDIVQTCIDLRTTLRAVPDGWRATVKTGWAQAKPRFAGITNPLIVTAISALDAAIGGL